jgi:predicted transcriptional regulator
MRKIDDKIIDKGVELFNQGLKFSQIARELHVSEDTIRKHLNNRGCCGASIFDRLKEGDIERIASLYLNNKWNVIFQEYPFLTKNRVYRLMSNNKVHKESYFWSKEEENILVQNYNQLPLEEIKKLLKNRFSEKAISNKAKKLGLTKNQFWTQEEIEIVKNNYSRVPMENMLMLLPNRTRDSITIRANSLKIPSYFDLCNKYSQSEKDFIKENSKILTDKEIAQILGKPLSGVQEQRRLLGIYYFNKNYSNYINLCKFLRGHLQKWKEASMKECNYQCIFTGSKDYEVHHLYSFNLILAETLNEYCNIYKLFSDNIDDYSKEQLDCMLKIFDKIHSSYPLGVCVRTDIHALFHKIYGTGGNTPNQWEKFKNDYYNHKYSEII